MYSVKRMDFVGITLFTAGLILLLIGLAWGGVAYPWKSGQVIATIIVGACCLIGFVIWGECLVPWVSRCGHI